MLSPSGDSLRSMPCDRLWRTRICGEVEYAVYRWRLSLWLTLHFATEQQSDTHTKGNCPQSRASLHPMTHSGVCRSGDFSISSDEEVVCSARRRMQLLPSPRSSGGMRLRSLSASHPKSLHSDQQLQRDSQRMQRQSWTEAQLSPPSMMRCCPSRGSLLFAAAVSCLCILPAGVCAADSSSTGAAGPAGFITPAVQAAIDSGINDGFANRSAEMRDLTAAIDSGWLLLTSFLIFFMQAGFALLEAGAVGSKDIISILLKNFTDFAISTITYWLVGEGFQRGHTPFIGASRGDDYSTDDPADMAVVLSASMFCATAVTIVSGAVACRFSFHAYMILCVVFSGFIYPITASWVWGQGFLSRFSSLTVIDFAGSGVVHLQGATIALTAAVFVGPRLGRFVVDPATGKTVPSTDFNGNSIVLTALGTLILWFGWYGFNPGSSGGLSAGRHQVAALAALNTAAAGSSALLTGLLLTRWMEKSYNFWDVLNSTLAGLVAVTAACATVGPAVALGIGILAAFTYHFTNKQVLRMGIDDVVGAFSVHGTPGMVGLICTGLFSRQDYIDAAFGEDIIEYHPGRQLGIQLLLLVCVVGWAGITSAIVLWILSKTIGIRVSSDDEIVGLDFKYHSGYAYETHNKRMLRAKKQIEREQILGQKMRKQHVTEAGAAAQQAGRGPSSPNNASRYNTLFRDAAAGMMRGKNSLGAPISANDLSPMQRTPVTGPVRSGGAGAAMNLNAPGGGGAGGGGGGGESGHHSGAPSFNNMPPVMDMMLAVPEFDENASGSSQDNSSLTQDTSMHSGQQHIPANNNRSQPMHIRTQSQGAHAAIPSSMPHSPQSNLGSLAPLHAYQQHLMQQQQQNEAHLHYAIDVAPLSPPSTLQPRSITVAAAASDDSAATQPPPTDGAMPGQTTNNSTDRSHVWDTSRSSRPPQPTQHNANAAAVAAGRSTAAASSQSAHSSPVQTHVRTISRHVSFNELDANGVPIHMPTPAGGPSTSDSAPGTATNSASATMLQGSQLPSFAHRVSLPSIGGASGVGSAPSPAPTPPTFHIEAAASSPKSLRRSAAGSTAVVSSSAASSATIHAPRPQPQAMPLHPASPQHAQQAAINKQPSPPTVRTPVAEAKTGTPNASTAAASSSSAASSPAAAAAATPAFQFKFVGAGAAASTNANASSPPPQQ